MRPKCFFVKFTICIMFTEYQHQIQHYFKLHFKINRSFANSTTNMRVLLHEKFKCIKKALIKVFIPYFKINFLSLFSFLSSTTHIRDATLFKAIFLIHKKVKPHLLQLAVKLWEMKQANNAVISHKICISDKNTIQMCQFHCIQQQQQQQKRH